jgi:SAM-dependent methyltransferase
VTVEPKAAGLARRGLFILVVLVGSFLLFLVQPMVARAALPLLGGSPSVWNSAMLVFQVLLLGGYAYAHALTRLSFRRQAGVHLGLLALAALTLPVALADIPPPAAGWEALWAPALVAATIGPVFLLLSAQASLMQRWYAGVAGGRDPYRLYAASNIGSFAGLLAFPFWLERKMALPEQSLVWSAGYLALIVLVAVAAASRWRVAEAEFSRLASAEPAPPVPRRHVLLWLALAAVPSGLMLSTTTLLTTDLMAMPLLWIIPLSAYLLSFPVAFSAHGMWVTILTRYAPILLLLVGGFAMISGGQSNPAIALAMVALLFVLSVALHGRLYALRPHPERLTFFYLMVAAGGALGGLFTALIAPVLFDWVYEHALLLLAAALLTPQLSFVPVLPRFWQSGDRRRHALALAAVLAAAVLAGFLAQAVEEGQGENILLLVSAIVVVGLLLIGKRWAFATTFALLMLGHGGLSTLALSLEGARSRSYFGVYTVQETPDGQMRRLNHGTTMHGQQFLDPARRLEPTSYYGRTSGIGLTLGAVEPEAEVGVVGLGVGTLACYRQPEQDWTFFEIDPDVVRYSRDRTFTFLSECAPNARIVIGDARLRLAEEPAGRFDLLAIDAFTSDAIPMHLMTREAFAVYDRTLAEDGLLLMHISNRFLDLAPMVAALAQEEDWHGRVREDYDVGEGQSGSLWIALARDEARLAQLQAWSARPWTPLPSPAPEAWTDDNSSLIPLLKF